MQQAMGFDPERFPDDHPHYNEIVDITILSNLVFQTKKQLRSKYGGDNEISTGGRYIAGNYFNFPNVLQNLIEIFNVTPSIHLANALFDLFIYFLQLEVVDRSMGEYDHDVIIAIDHIINFIDATKKQPLLVLLPQINTVNLYIQEVRRLAKVYPLPDKDTITDYGNSEYAACVSRVAGDIHGTLLLLDKG
ncbi:hypothetical protein KC640_02895, partial [Candidatus Dojkabacteria bacterium]|nr:hypothetical protein [Candidatus Dojkabacteria bacterium]